MKKFYHPMRDAEIHIWERVNGNGKGSSFLGRLYPYELYPIFSSGSTVREARDKLEALREEAYRKHEEAFISRQKATVKAKETRAKRKAND